MSFWDDLSGYVNDAQTQINDIQNNVTSFLDSSPIGALVKIAPATQNLTGAQIAAGMRPGNGAISPPQSAPPPAPVSAAVTPQAQVIGGVDLKLPLIALGGLILFAVLSKRGG